MAGPVDVATRMDQCRNFKAPVHVHDIHAVHVLAPVATAG